MNFTQILPLRWLHRPKGPAQFCLRCGSEFEDEGHILCAHCRAWAELKERHAK